MDVSALRSARSSLKSKKVLQLFVMPSDTTTCVPASTGHLTTAFRTGSPTLATESVERAGMWYSTAQGHEDGGMLSVLGGTGGAVPLVIFARQICALS
jgi:hypothetical protein